MPYTPSTASTRAGFLTGEIEFAAKTEAEKRPRFKGVAFSGNIVPDQTYDGAAAEIVGFNLSTEGEKIFILGEHNSHVKVGHATAYLSDGKVLLRDGQFFDTPHGNEYAVMLSEGAPFEYSIGFRGQAEFIDKGKRKKVKYMGREHEIGVRLSDVRLHETSFVIKGADLKTQVRAYAAGDIPLNTKPPTENADMSEKELEAAQGEIAALKVQLSAATKTATDAAAALEAQAAELKALTDAAAAAQFAARGAELKALGVPDADAAELGKLTDVAYASMVKVLTGAKKPAAADSDGKPAQFGADGKSNSGGEKVSLLRQRAAAAGLHVTKKGA